MLRRDLDVRAVLQVGDLLVVEDDVVRVAGEAADDQDVALLDEPERAGVGLRTGSATTRPRRTCVCGQRDVGEDHRHAGLAGRVDRGHQRGAGDRLHDDRVDALADHLLDRRDLLLGRRGGDRRRDVRDQRAGHEALRLGLRELRLEAVQHVLVVGVGDRERDVADLPGALHRLGVRPRARVERARVARVDRSSALADSDL